MFSGLQAVYEFSEKNTTANQQHIVFRSHKGHGNADCPELNGPFEIFG